MADTVWPRNLKYLLSGLLRKKKSLFLHFITTLKINFKRGREIIVFYFINEMRQKCALVFFSPFCWENGIFSILVARRQSPVRLSCFHML